VTPDAVVVGAGPAGSAAAAVLSRAGRSVLILEKDRFPRPKVCGEFLSASALPDLDLLGVRGRVEEIAERIEQGFVHLPGGRSLRFALPRPALGISRLRLDAMLASRAEELGARSSFGARVTAVDGAPDTGFRVRFVSGGREEIATARAVIGAWGRWDSLDRTLHRGFLGAPARYLGWSRDAEPDRGLEGQVRLYAFPGGYCGLSRVEGGAVNLAGVISERRRGRLAPGWEAVVAHARAANRRLDSDLAALRAGPIGFLGTGPVFFTAKPPVENGILMVGDAAGVIDPFSGEGQAAALSSGILAAQTLERGLSGEVPLAAVGKLYADGWRRRFRQRFGWSSAFRRLMLHPSVGGTAGRWMGESVVRFAISRLSSRA